MTNLLAEKVIDGEVLLKSLSGKRDRTVEALTPALLAARIDPGRILDEVFRTRSWSGEESKAILNDLEFFAKLKQRKPELDEVCSLAAEQLSRQLETALAQEKHDKRHG